MVNSTPRDPKGVQPLALRFARLVGAGSWPAAIVSRARSGRHALTLRLAEKVIFSVESAGHAWG